MSEPAGAAGAVLTASCVSKLYARRTQPMRARLGGTIGRAIIGMRPMPISGLAAHEFWAVDNVSFRLARGEALGVIGLNGSGKTTLLRMLAGQILPDKGEIVVGGSSAAMIDLQAGFQPAASGRENIFLRAAALGFNRRRTLERLEEIVAFSELGDAIDAPMASYSSGMKMRLAFSVMVMVSPDVLLIDEVLAVGDFRFRQKCLAKIREMRARSAFVFVSHSMDDVARFCNRVIVMHKGGIHFEGPAPDAIETYQALNHETPAPGKTDAAAAMGPVFSNEKAIAEIEHYWCDENGARIGTIRFGEKLRLLVRFRPTIDIRKLVIGVPVWNVNAQYTTGLSTEIASDALDVKAGDVVKLMLEAEGGVINPGTLKSMLTVLDGVEFIYRRPNPDLEIQRALHPTWGAVTVPHRWRRIQ